MSDVCIGEYDGNYNCNLKIELEELGIGGVVE
jgi:hypothetical protein